MNLQEKLKSLKQLVDEMEKLIEQEREFPQEGDKYWFMSDSGGAIDISFYSNYYIDSDRIDIGNFFKGREEAEFAVEKLKVEAELRKFSGHFEEGKNNYFMVFDTNYASVDILGMSYSRVQGVIYFESEEKGQQAIESVGEYRIKKYIFGVED